MSEKEKPKRGSKMSLLRSCLIFALYPLLIFAVMGMGLAYWAIGGYVKPSLDAQYIPTAEYLLEHPIVNGAERELITFVANAVPNQELYVCDLGFTIITFPDDESFNLDWAELFINEQLVTRAHMGAIEIIGYSSTYCYEGHLDSGLHIIEMRVKKHLFAEPYYIQRWAIEIP